MGRSPMKHAAPYPEVLHRLEESIKVPTMELDFHDTFQLLVSTVLSAQTTDKTVNRVTPALFSRYPDASSLSRANLEDLETLLKPTGFFHRKALHIKALAEALTEKFGARVPDSIEQLVTLPGVGRKTASVVLAHGFNKPAIFVDTHVGRVCRRLGWTRSNDPDKVEETLARHIPREEWIAAASRLLLHGRYVCLARSPKCASCVLFDICPSSDSP